MKKLRIGPYDWKYKEKAKLSEGVLGECDYSKLTISIAKNLPAEIKKVTILHELFHAFIDSSGVIVDEEEQIVDTLANSLLLFIQENPDFFIQEICAPFGD
jgi:Zn-dependent peptidase ImmA (M78 family)